MFRRRRAHRGLRQIPSSNETRNSVQDDFTIAELVDELYCWASSLPWVVELPLNPGELDGRGFAIDCPPLDSWAMWLTLGPFDDLSLPIEIYVVVPRYLAQRGFARDWAVPVADLDEDRLIVGVATPTTPIELRALEGLLEVAYRAAFVTSDSSSTPKD
jgi:hypothetical protein